MESIRPLLDLVAPYMLVLTRLSGLVLAAPGLSGTAIPNRFKAVLVMMFTAALLPSIPAQDADIPAHVDLFTLAPIMATEVMIGLIIGFLATLPLTALQMSGLVCGFQMGLAMARAVDPNTQADNVVIGQLLYYLAFGVFLVSGGLDQLFLSVAGSFEHVPVGAFWFDQTPIATITGVLTSSFDLGLRVAAPVTTVILLIMVAMGLIMKTMPQINVLTLGFAVKIVVGLFVLMLSLTVAANVVGDEIQDVFASISEWVLSMGEARASS
jgi:flagellar biosynthetic protein FliR